MTQDKIVFIDEISSAFYPIVKKYLDNDFAIYFFKTDDKYRRMPAFKEYLAARKLIDISPMIFEYAAVYRQAVFYAHENVDLIFNKHYAHSHSIKNMSNLLNFPEIENMYKYGLLRELENIYVTELKINEIVKGNDSGEIYFYPRNNFKIHSDRSSLLNKNIKVIHNNNLRTKLKRISGRTRQILVLGLLIGSLFKSIKGVSNNSKPKEFKVGIMDDYPSNSFLMNYFGNNIFLDETELPEEEVLFIVPWVRDELDLKAHRPFNCAGISDSREIISSALFWHKLIRRFIPAWFKSILSSFWGEPLIVDTNRTILADYIRWNIFADNYKINNYVKRLLPDRISKTRILSQHNIKTWFVYPDNTAHNYHLDWDETKKYQTLYSFMYYDNIIIYGDIVERHFKKHRNFIARYIKTGVLFSQTVQELQTGKLASPIFTIMKQKKLPKKIIGVFDTAFTDQGPLKIKDGPRFGSDILRLLDELPDVGIIFKAAKEPELTPHLTPIYDRLKSHERCLLFYRFSQEGISAPEVIAVSDLVVSAAYTSTTAEALGARIKGIYYDVAGHNIGDKYYFNRLPNFVAHSYEELKQLIHYWMYEVTDEEFDDFLNTYVKDEIDPYLDGKALSRFRNLLMRV